MKGATKERWMMLCEQAAKEQDPQKLLELVREINDILSAKQKRLSDERDEGRRDGRICDMSQTNDTLCKCGHAFSSHTRNVRDAGTARVDDALLTPKRYDITTDRPAGESGCTECSCNAWRNAQSA